MERRSGSTAAVTAAEVQASLAKTKVLSAEEEKGLRMRYGGKVDLGQPLPQVATGHPEVEDELLLIEMQLLKAWKMRLGGQGAPRTVSRTKDKIVRALRKKK